MQKPMKSVRVLKGSYICLVLILIGLVLLGSHPGQVRADGNLLKEVSNEAEFIAAFQNPPDGRVVKLVGDITLKLDSLWVPDIEGSKIIQLDKKVTLDGNGYKLTLENQDEKKTRYVFHIQEGGKLTLEKAEIEHVKAYEWGDEGINVILVQKNEGTLIVNSTAGIGLLLQGLLAENTGVAEIVGGSISTNGSIFGHHSETIANRGSILVKGGDLNSRNHFVVSNGEDAQVRIEDGDITTEGSIVRDNDGSLFIEKVRYLGDNCVTDNSGVVEIQDGEFVTNWRFINNNLGQIKVEFARITATGSFVINNMPEASIFIKDADITVDRIADSLILPGLMGTLVFDNEGDVLIQSCDFQLAQGLVFFNDGSLTLEDGDYESEGALVVVNDEDATIMIRSGNYKVASNIPEEGRVELYHLGFLFTVNEGKITVLSGNFQSFFGFILDNKGGELEINCDDYKAGGAFIFHNDLKASIRVVNGKFDVTALSGARQPTPDDDEPGDEGELEVPGHFIFHNEGLLEIDEGTFSSEEAFVLQQEGRLRIKAGSFTVDRGSMFNFHSSDEPRSDSLISGGLFLCKDAEDGVINLHGGDLVLKGGKFVNESGKAAFRVSRQNIPPPTLDIPDPYVAYPRDWEEEEAPVIEILQGTSLTVSCVVTGEGADQEKIFSYVLELDRPLIDGVYGDLLFNSGLATFDLKHGESVMAPKLPGGTGYCIVQSGQDDDYTVQTGQVSGDSEEGALSAGSPLVIAYSNRYTKVGSGGPPAGGDPGGSSPGSLVQGGETSEQTPGTGGKVPLAGEATVYILAASLTLLLTLSLLTLQLLRRKTMK